MTIKYRWEQVEVIHCPIMGCKGMLLTHALYNEHKCSDCKKYFQLTTQFTEVKPRVCRRGAR